MKLNKKTILIGLAIGSAALIITKYIKKQNFEKLENFEDENFEDENCDSTIDWSEFEREENSKKFNDNAPENTVIPEEETEKMKC